MTIGQVAELVREIVGNERSVRIVRKPDVSDCRNYVVSFDKIRSVLEFEASVSMREGVEDMVRQFKAGTYGDYRAPFYSNLEMTKQALSDFRDPVQSARLYAPMGEAPALPRRASNRVGTKVALIRPSPAPNRARDAAPPRSSSAGVPTIPHTS
jgi:hypothetical protein